MELPSPLVEHGLPLPADIPRRGSRHTAAAPLRRCAAGALPPFVALLRLRRNAAPHSGRVPPFAPPRRWLARRSPHNGAPRIECGAMRCPSSRSAATQRGALHCITARCAPGGRSPNGRGTGEKGLNRRPTRREDTGRRRRGRRARRIGLRSGVGCCNIVAQQSRDGDVTVAQAIAQPIAQQ